MVAPKVEKLVNLNFWDQLKVDTTKQKGEQIRPGLSALTEVIKLGSDVLVSPNLLLGAGVKFGSRSIRL